MKPTMFSEALSKAVRRLGSCSNANKAYPIAHIQTVWYLLAWRKMLQNEQFTRGATWHSECTEELRFHSERHIGENIAASMTPEDARRAALCEFRGVEQIKRSAAT